MPRPDLREAAVRGLQGSISCRSARSSPNIRRSSSRCRSTRPISTSPRTSKASPRATEIAERIKAKIRAETQPDRVGWHLLQQVPGQARLRSSQAGWSLRHHAGDGAELRRSSAGRKFHGIGPATAAKMNRLGIFTGLDLRAQDDAFLQAHFGKAGRYFYWICRGIDEGRFAPIASENRSAPRTPFRATLRPDDMRAELGAAHR